MDPAKILTVRFHFGGEFVRIGPTFDYVGGDEAISEIEGDKMSLQELKGFLKDHMTVKDAMKFYFLLPDSDLVNGLLFLYDDAGCMKICEHTTDAGVADIYVEYQGEQDDVSQSSGSDFEADELINLDDSEEDIPGLVLTAVPDGIVPIAARLVDEAVILDNVLVPDGTGVISQVLSSPVKEINGSGAAGHKFVRMERGSSSQALNSSQVIDPSHSTEEKEEINSDSEEDTDYVPHSDDSGEESEVVNLRSKAKQFRRKMRASHRWIDSEDANGPVPIDLVANVEEVMEEINKENEFESSDEDYSYDEDSDGQLVRKKSRYIRFNPDTEVPHFSLAMGFRSKNQLCKSIRRYGLVTKRSISFLKSEVDRVRVKCDWPACPWLLYAAKRTRCSRFQIITFNDEHECAQNRDNHLLTAKVIAKKYDHFILANPTWKTREHEIHCSERFLC
jgi:hypothetical protein